MKFLSFLFILIGLTEAYRVTYSNVLGDTFRLKCDMLLYKSAMIRDTCYFAIQLKRDTVAEAEKACADSLVSRNGRAHLYKNSPNENQVKQLLNIDDITKYFTEDNKADGFKFILCSAENPIYCEEGASYFEGACYKISSPSAQSGKEAVTTCKSSSSVLPSMFNERVARFISEQAKGVQGVSGMWLNSAGNSLLWQNPQIINGKDPVEIDYKSYPYLNTISDESTCSDGTTWNVEKSTATQRLVMCATEAISAFRDPNTTKCLFDLCNDSPRCMQGCCKNVPNDIETEPSLPTPSPTRDPNYRLAYWAVCEKMNADIVLLFDTSAWDAASGDAVRVMGQVMARQFELGAATRLSVMTFNEDVVDTIPMGAITEPLELSEKVTTMNFKKTSTKRCMGKALRKATKMIIDSDTKQDRLRKVFMLLGGSDTCNTADLTAAIKESREYKIDIFILGIGPFFYDAKNEPGLGNMINSMTNGRTAKQYEKRPIWQWLGDVTALAVNTQMCAPLIPRLIKYKIPIDRTWITVSQVCDSFVGDLIIAVDSTVIDTEDRKDRMRTILRAFSLRITQGIDARVAIVSYTDNVLQKIPLNKYTLPILYPEIEYLDMSPSSKRCTSSAFNDVVGMFPDQNRNRRLLFITFGQNDCDSASLKSAAASAKAKGIITYALGVGANMNKSPSIDELITITGDRNRVYYLSDYDELNATFTLNVTQQICPKADVRKNVVN